MYGGIDRSVGRSPPSLGFFLPPPTFASPPPRRGVNGQRLMVPLSLSLTLPRSAPPRLSFSLAVPLSFSLCFSPPLSPSLHLYLYLSLSRGVIRVTTHYRVPFSVPASRCFFPHSVLHLRSLLLPPARPLPRRNYSAPNGVMRRSERSGVCTRIGPRSMTD